MRVTKKAELARKLIKDNCQTCRGFGCKDCMQKIERINAFSAACIPVAYWDYNLKTFGGDDNFRKHIENYIKDLNKLYADGKSLALVGRHGVGKTFGACEILKAAVLQKYVAKYTTMSEIVDIILSKDYEFKVSLLHSDVLVIDEFDSRYIPTSDRGKETFGANLENIIRTRFQNKLPIIFCTNNSSLNEVFDDTFKQTFDSLFSESNLTVIAVGGIDLR